MGKKLRDEELKSWERQPRESAEAYSAFCLYRDMGDKRSVRAVARLCNKSFTLVGRWSSKWGWVERCRNYDNELQREKHEAKLKEIDEMNNRHAAVAYNMMVVAANAIKNLDYSKLSPRDIKEFVKAASALERIARQGSIQERAEEEHMHDAQTVHIILPDNGRQ